MFQKAPTDILYDTIIVLIKNTSTWSMIMHFFGSERHAHCPLSWSEEAISGPDKKDGAAPNLRGASHLKSAA